MRIWERFQRGRRAPRPVGQQLERGREAEALQARRRQWMIKAAIWLGLILLTLLAFPRERVYQFTVRVGEVWQHNELVAPFDFALYKDAEQLARERRQVILQTPPYFREVPNALRRMEANRDTVRAQLEAIFNAYARYRHNLLRGRQVAAQTDSIRYVELRRNARVKLTSEQWRLLAEDYLAAVSEAGQVVRRDGREPLYAVLLQEAWAFGVQVLRVGLLDVPRDSVRTDEIVVRNETERTERLLSADRVFGLDEAYSAAREYFLRQLNDRPDLASIALAFYRAILVPSYVYLRAETLHAWQQQQARLSPTYGLVKAGEVIVQRGQVVTEEIKRKLVSLERAQQERGGPALFWRRLLGQTLVTLATYLFFFLYLYLLRRPIFENNTQVFLIALLFAAILGLYAIAVRLPTLAMYAVPVAIASILLTVIFDSRVALFGTITLAFIGGHLLSYDFEFAFATVFAGTLGIFSVRDIKNRGQFFRSAGLVFLGYLVVLGASALWHPAASGRFLSDLLLVGINAMLVLLAYPLLWVFERAFDITTDLTLLELSDTNRPLLKELSLRAPGTFNHSLQVANLAEAAAAAIGAHALLVRVGALYHDIGKMVKPEYFVENQRPGMNPHENLKPRMSALIIASHVKEGLEIGRQYGLPKKVLDFIPMHHGTTRIEYFYRKAVEQTGDPELPDAEFRYPGPKPNSKETAILMLADSVEAASRSLEEPTHKRLEALIDQIFRDRIDDGQLDDTDLTFRDLQKIKETFLQMLLAIYHIRVKYPGSEDQESSEKSEASAASTQDE
ncbi:MAG: HDIG domain-containing protein [Rhodothermus sp.]|nr:HDIG domain-containing protein [Rhodothermus sp.]